MGGTAFKKTKNGLIMMWGIMCLNKRFLSVDESISSVPGHPKNAWAYIK